MAISQSKYINIVSSVGGGSNVAKRDLIGRIFDTNYLVPTGQVLEFTGGAINALASIGEYFGTQSAEYIWASKYFQPGKNTTAPQKLSFARYLTADAPAQLIGAPQASTLSQLQAISNGDLNIVINGADVALTDINLSAATSFADVATTLTAALTDHNATATYDAVNGRFVIATTETGASATIGAATGTVAQALGLLLSQAIISNGAGADSAVRVLGSSSSLSNNFFSFTFMGVELSNEDLTAIGQWTTAQNVRYMYSGTVTAEDAATVQPLVAGMDGVALTLDIYGADAEFMPMSRIAAIDYNQRGAALSMNYQQFAGVRPSVLTDADASKYDALKINYYGATQQGGQQVAWYQPGVLQGSISDMGVFANEAWMKDSFAADLLNLRLGLNTLPANQTGVGLVLATLMKTVNQALFNGVILADKTLDATQKAFITQISDNPDAWQSVQVGGYYLDCNLVKYTENGVEKYKASYLLIYGKGDSINYIDGRDILI